MKGKRENPCWHTQKASGALAVVVLLREWAPRCVVGPRGCSTLPSLQRSLTSCPRDSTRGASSPPRSAMCRPLLHKLFQAANANFPPCIGSVWGEGVRLVQQPGKLLPGGGLVLPGEKNHTPAVLGVWLSSKSH